MLEGLSIPVSSVPTRLTTFALALVVTEHLFSILPEGYIATLAAIEARLKLGGMIGNVRSLMVFGLFFGALTMIYSKYVCRWITAVKPCKKPLKHKEP